MVNGRFIKNSFFNENMKLILKDEKPKLLIVLISILTFACKITIILSLRSRIYLSMASRVNRLSSCNRNIELELLLFMDPLPVLAGPLTRGSNALCCDGGLGEDCAKPGNPY